MRHQIIEGCFAAATNGKENKKVLEDPTCGNLRQNTLEVGLP